MSDVSEDLDCSLQEELDRAIERAERAEIEAHIAWEALAVMRECLVKYGVNITMMRDYEVIRVLEGGGLYQEIDRRIVEKRARRIIQVGEQLATVASDDEESTAE